MGLLIMSDTHGLINPVMEIMKVNPSEKIIHCGDFCVESDQSPFDQMIKVRGNCDFDHRPPLEQIIEWQGLKIFVTHGHKYNIKMTPMRLVYRALELGVNVVCFGHTHVPVCKKYEGIIFLNPGSLAHPRKYPKPTYVVLDKKQIGETGSPSIIVRYYDNRAKEVDEFRRTYQL